MRVSKMESDNMLIALGTSLLERREAAKLTRSQLARKVGLKTDEIYRIEVGEYKLTVRQLYAIVRAVGAKLSDIFR
jgi:DNA-binding XRE family transcriptional regulator